MFSALAGGLGALIGGVSLMVLPAAILSLLGFGGAGVAAGSVAAGIHSGIGNVTAGSLFAFLQSVGVTGIGVGAQAALGTVGSILGGLFGLLPF